MKYLIEKGTREDKVGGSIPTHHVALEFSTKNIATCTSRRELPN
jgi:hypothetical protein